MIELNEKTQQDFLNREWVQKLLNAGIDMSDAKYYICSLTIGNPSKPGGNIKIALKEELPWIEGMPGFLPTAQYNWCCPTYTTAELLYKLNEWPSIKLSEEKYIGAKLEIFKDAPFYFACYYFSKTEKNDEYRKYDIECCSEYPIEAMAQLLIASAKSNFYNFKYVKDISSK